jgi:hypothetical protein
VLEIIGDTLVPIADRWTKPWAAFEEWLIKRSLLLGRMKPWLEVYASR